MKGIAAHTKSHDLGVDFRATGFSAFKLFQDQDAGTLSGGEKTKLALAQLVMGGHNVLLLDEPTNNLDPQARESLLDAIAHFEGTIILVSHDADFVEELVPDRVALMPEGDLAYYDESMLELVSLR